MTAPDTSAPAAQGDGAETWRVVLESTDGVRVEVKPDLTADACFCNGRPGVRGRCYCGALWLENGAAAEWNAHGVVNGLAVRESGSSPRVAVLQWARSFIGWTPVEILAPGEATRAELIAERDAAIARAVAEEREACAAVCDEIEHELKVEAMLEREDGDGDEAASDEQAVGASACAAAIRARGGAQ